MSEQPNHNKQYTFKEIEAYLDGRLSAKDMHDLERAALDDPFLADAIEGMQSSRAHFTDQVIHQHLQESREQLSARIGETKLRRIGFWGWRQLAAAALVILVAGVWMYRNYNDPDKEPSQIAQELPATKPSSPEKEVADSGQLKGNADDTGKKGNIASPPSFAVTDSRNKLTSPAESKQTVVKKIVSAAPSGVVRSPQVAPTKSYTIDRELSANTRRESGKNEDSQLADSNKKDNLEVSISDEKEKAEALKPAQLNILKNATGAGNPFVFKGRVVDNTNKPLAFASVFLNDQKTGVTTDQNGYFLLPASDSVLSVNIASIGYVTQNVQLNNRNMLNQVQLVPSNSSLNEVVVVNGLGAKKRSRSEYQSRLPRVLVQDAEPVNGWIAYQQYLDSSNILRDTTTEEDVVVSFLVDKAGKLSNFKVEQSLSEKQDAEALRLIKEGPAWHLLKGKKARVIVMVRF